MFRLNLERLERFGLICCYSTNSFGGGGGDRIRPDPPPKPRERKFKKLSLEEIEEQIDGLQAELELKKKERKLQDEKAELESKLNKVTRELDHVK